MVRTTVIGGEWSAGGVGEAVFDAIVDTDYVWVRRCSVVVSGLLHRWKVTMK